MHKTSPFNNITVNITLYADFLYFQIYFQLQGLFYSDTKVLLKKRIFQYSSRLYKNSPQTS